MVDALGSLLKGVGLASSSLLANLGVISGTESILDARMVNRFLDFEITSDIAVIVQEIDKELRDSCDAFIDYCSKTLTKSLQDFVEKCSAVLLQAGKPLSLSSRDFAQADKLLEIHDSFKRECSTGIAQWMRWLRLYLETENTAQVLIPPLQSQIVEEYTKFWEIVRSNYPPEVVERVMSLTDLWAFLKDNSRIEQ
jgi:hypothetical protein